MIDGASKIAWPSKDIVSYPESQRRRPSENQRFSETEKLAHSRSENQTVNDRRSRRAVE